MTWAFSSCNHGCFDSSTVPTVMACFVAFEEIEKICWDWSSFSVDICKKNKTTTPKKTLKFWWRFPPIFIIVVPWRPAKRWTSASNDQPKETPEEWFKFNLRLSNMKKCQCLLGFDEAHRVPTVYFHLAVWYICNFFFCFFFFAFDVKPIEAFQCM